MSEKRTTARAFHDAVGVEDWRVLFSGAHAYFHVGSFAEAARFVAAIAEVAEVVGHFPDVDVRPEGVTVRTACWRCGVALRYAEAVVTITDGATGYGHRDGACGRVALAEWAARHQHASQA